MAPRRGQSKTPARKEVPERDVGEFDDSINDRLDRIRRAFEVQFPYVFAGDGTGYTYVVDIFDDHVVCKTGDKYHEVSFTEKGDDVTFDAKDDWVAVKLSYVAEMLTGNFHDVIIISEFKGKYPEVPFFDDINLEELTAGDSKPTYVTLPIGLVNAKSGNGRYYDESFVTELEKQVRDVKPIGLMGHLSSDQLAHDFPVEAVHWVGAQRVNELLWGKGYVPAGEPRDRLQRYKATKKKIATSIFAKADGIWDTTVGAWRMVAETLRLAQIDIAPADRAGISDLAAVPMLTAEMLESGSQVASGSSGSVVSSNPRITEGSMAEKDEIVKGLKAADADGLPEEVRAAIVSGQVEEMRKTLGLEPGADIFKAFADLKKESDTQAAKTVNNRIQELVSDPESGIKIDTVRSLVMEIVMARKPATVAEAEAIYTEVAKSEAVQKALSTVVQETMGPNQTTPTPGQHGEKKGKYFVIPVIKE